HDLFSLIPHEGFQEFVASPWGEPLLLLLVITGAVIWFPVLLVRILGCVPLPPGETRDRIAGFCDDQSARFAGILSWPLHEGRALTAGVIGLVGRYRYLLVTPALLESLSGSELDSVVAHEIGHVKKKHLLLYLVLFLGFLVLVQFCVQPLLYLILNTRLYYELLFGYDGDAGAMLALLTGGVLVVATVLYVRYVFGFFMRNFERQADLYGLEVMGTAKPLVEVFEKISRMSGNIRDRSCWHHFGLGQRIDYLLACEGNKGCKAAHDRKIYYSLAAYFLVLVISLPVTLQVGELLVGPSPGRQIAEDVIIERTIQEPENPLWHQFHGDLLIDLGKKREAIAAFERSLTLDPQNPEALNNLAWLLLTVEDKGLLDPARALELAEKAVGIQARSHILDTLAEAYWQNNQGEMAVETELKAIDKSPDNIEYYRKQLDKFRKSTS
ncbi:MAG: M48 family metalloprotease, partial [Thermodesulfobacteriota bacterium]